MIRICHRLLAVVAGLYADSNRASPLETVAGLPALVDARQLGHSQQLAVEKIYPLGSVRRISGQLRFSAELTISGERNLTTWQLSPVHTADAAFAQVREHLQQEGSRLLYWCEGRDCGPSNLWANSVFGNARLYGPDERQRYAVLVSATSPELFALYTVTRGNGRMPTLSTSGQTTCLTTCIRCCNTAAQLRNDGQLSLPMTRATQC